MKSSSRSAMLLVAAALVLPAAASAGEHRFGIGYHKWEAIDNISDSGLESSGNSKVFSYQYLSSAVLRYEIDVEYFADGYGGSGETAYAPQAYILIGRFFYAGVGVGITNSDGLPDGKSWSDPWYALKGGIDLLLLPKIHLDFNANYRTDAFSSLDNASTDSLTYGLSLRLSLN